jgi:DNA helicase HerA-like ATPase
MEPSPLKLNEIFEPASQSQTEKFKNPDEEIAYLREQLAQKERKAEQLGVPVSREQVAEDIVQEYKKEKVEDVLDENMKMSHEEAEGVALQLSPEEHDNQVQQLFGVLMEKGIKNALSVVNKMDSPHIDDDFHRFLVQYLQAAHNIPGLVNKSELYKALDMRLFEVTLPEPEEEGGKSISELVSMMEQFLAGMQAISSGTLNLDKNYYSLEVAIPAGSDQIVFYVALPSGKVDLFEKQVLGLYDKAKIEEVFDDYNIFADDGGAAGSYAKAQYKDIFQLKTYENIDHDPLKVLLNVFSKLDRETEGAAIQIMIRPVGDRYIKKFGTALDELKKGERMDVALNAAYKESQQIGRSVWKASKELFFNQFDEYDEGKDSKDVDENAVQSITDKLKSSIVETNIRIVASGRDDARARDILADVQSAFQQFNDTHGNAVSFESLTGSKLKQMFHDYSYRMFHDKKLFRLNLKELASMYHFPIASDSSPQLKQARAGAAPAPVDLPDDGQILLGINNYRGKDTYVHMQKEDRVRHMYVIGQTGTGKTNILKNMIIQDIRNGDGCCFIDPHGSDVEDILALIPPERIDDVIYFDPAATERPMAFNMLEYDPKYPEQKSFVIDEMLGIFNKLFDMKTAGGPMFEQYFRNATALVVEDPETGCTLLDVSRVLADEEFRKLKLSRCKNPIVVQFWEEIAQKAGGEASLQNIVPYITSKFDVFLSNEIMRPIVSQQQSSFNFRKAMDEKKILLINLSKGRLGEINANLLGLIMVGKILMAALSRVDAPKEQRPDFYLYIDEFQNVTTDSIAQILSEARKYRLSLNVAHQFIAQLEENIKNAVFGNVGSMAVFRVSSDDAQYLESRFKPTFDATDIMKIDNYHAYISMLSNGQPIKPFNIKTLPPEDGDMERAKKLKELSSMKYGRPRAEVEAEVMAKYRKQKTEAPVGEQLGV